MSQAQGRVGLGNRSARVIALITAIVLIAHYAVLSSLKPSLSIESGTASKPWITRTITPPTPPAPSTAAAPQRRTTTPKPPETTAAVAPAPTSVEPPSSAPNEQAPVAAAPETPTTSPDPVPAEPPVEVPLPVVQADPAAPGLKVAVPGSLKLQYDLKGQSKQLDYSARGELIWRHDGQHYEARMEIAAFLVGSRVQTSRGVLGPNGLVPERFGDKSRSEQAAHFEWDRQRVVFSANTPTAPLQAGAQDRLSVLIQLAAQAGANPRLFAIGTTHTIQTISAREAEIWNILVEAQEVISIPQGRIPTVRVVRQPRRPFDQRIEVWMAPELNYLPVRLRITNANGDFVDQQLRDVSAP